MKIVKVNNYEELSAVAADLIAKQIKAKPASVIGLATGSTPIGTYKNLVEMHKRGDLNFIKVKTFNLDEYCGLARDDAQSYYYFMMDNLFKHINIPKVNIHFPAEKDSDWYDKEIAQAGGIDLQLLGIGSNGHIGFNEPEDVFHKFTRVVDLAPSTIKANARFFKKMEDVPKTAISMGIGTIMAAKKIVLIAGADKAELVKELTKPVISPQLPASILHFHPDATIITVTSR